MSWFTFLFKRKELAPAEERYTIKLSVCHETYTVEEFDLQFKRDTDRNGLPDGEAYGGFITCTLTGIPGDGLLRWAAYSRLYEDGDLRIYQKDDPDLPAVFALHFTDGNCIRFQRRIDSTAHTCSVTLLFAARILKLADEEFENNWH